MSPGKTYDASPTSAIIESSDGTMRFTIDGDLHEQKGAVELSTGPRVKILLT